MSSSMEAWHRKDFQEWTSAYLRSLWFSRDPAAVRLVLEDSAAHGDRSPALPLLRANPLLGLKVFLPNTGDDVDLSFGVGGGGGGGAMDNAVGGFGFQNPSDHVVSLLQSVIVDDDAANTDGAQTGLEAGSIALITKRGLAIAYLETLVKEGVASKYDHNRSVLLPDSLAEALSLRSPRPSSLAHALSSRLCAQSCSPAPRGIHQGGEGGARTSRCGPKVPRETKDIPRQIP